MRAVMLHSIPLRKRPPARGGESSGTAELRIIHLPLFQDNIFVAEAKRPKKIKNKPGIFLRNYDVPFHILLKKFLIIANNSAAPGIQRFKFRTIDHPRSNHSRTKVAPRSR